MALIKTSGPTYKLSFFNGVSRGPVVKCLTLNQGDFRSCRTVGSSEYFFRGSVLGHDTSDPQPGTGETQERHE